MAIEAYLQQAVSAVHSWEREWGPFERHPVLEVDTDRMQSALRAYLDRLKGNYPFFHPRYAGQMLKPPHPAAVTAYLAAMLVNPNNHALDGGPPTAQMEKEVVAGLAAMFGLPASALGHLTSSGTIANLEALWVSRQLHPEKAIAFSADAHYTHSRMGEVLGIRTIPISADQAGRMDVQALEEQLRTGQIGTVVVTAGTTSQGAVDPVADVLPLARQYGCRVHVDAAYGGFFVLHAGEDSSLLTLETRRHLQAIGICDSVVIDPHKHGLQPYGCGCVLFRDPTIGRLYKHDSPYTYFTSEELHLGEISLECSRAGAAAGALWLTLQVLPLKADEGLGPILAACLRAARTWHRLLQESGALRPYAAPELDIVTFFPAPGIQSASAIDAASARLFTTAMQDTAEPIFLSLLRVDTARLAANIPGLLPDQPQARILRSVLMKPEHEFAVEHLHRRLTTLARWTCL
jgi:glutamate/tyrosine decarboxylase-like PLP-dependent enzyme